MRYYRVRFKQPQGMEEILVAFLGEAGFEMFEDSEEGLLAFIPEAGRSDEDVMEAVRNVPVEFTGSDWEVSLTEDRNWNEEWEKAFDAVEVAGRVLIRAPFHAPASDPETIELIVEPKMSFGTGHHPTTALMVEAMLDCPLRQGKVLDMGCGSGILAILAEKLGAADVIAIDIDDWSVENTLENMQRNHCSHIQVLKGNASAITGGPFDVILANINRNILLQDLPAYSRSLEMGGRLLMSGFLQDDRNVLLEAAAREGLQEARFMTNEQWTMIELKK